MVDIFSIYDAFCNPLFLLPRKHYIVGGNVRYLLLLHICCILQYKVTTFLSQRQTFYSHRTGNLNTPTLYPLRENASPARLSGNFVHREPAVEKKSKTPIHIGSIIKAKMEQFRLAPIDVYSKMNMSRQNFYYHIDKASMDTEMLDRFSAAIGYNLHWEYISEEERGDKRAEMLQKELDATKAELALTKEKLMAQYEIALKKRA